MDPDRLTVSNRILFPQLSVVELTVQTVRRVRRH
ncbi:Uncharacterised protein [Vibrio cholerae]|nr:Uncharacterised protein [Vibrio cholerae]